uniref:Uncharacterized protein n=1 Tax=Varanus komodoensis TaxID=61221 RepID=A0A8D2LI97_VARKO
MTGRERMHRMGSRMAIPQEDPTQWCLGLRHLDWDLALTLPCPADSEAVICLFIWPG